MLVNIVLLVISIPQITRLLQLILVNNPLNLIVPLHKLQRKPLSRMPSNMAMHQPRPRVIRLPRHNQIPIRRQHRSIPSRRVIRLNSPIPGIQALRENEKVMPVQMNRMENRLGRAHDEINPLVRIGQVNHRTRVVPHLQLILTFPVCDLLQRGVFPEDFHSRAVEEPPEQTVGVAVGCSLRIVLPVWGLDGAWDVRDEVFHGLVVAVVLGGPEACLWGAWGIAVVEDTADVGGVFDC